MPLVFFFKLITAEAAPLAVCVCGYDYIICSLRFSLLSTGSVLHWQKKPSIKTLLPVAMEDGPWPACWVQCSFPSIPSSHFNIYCIILIVLLICLYRARVWKPRPPEGKTVGWNLHKALYLSPALCDESLTAATFWLQTSFYSDGWM